MNTLKAMVKRLLNTFGYDIKRLSPNPISQNEIRLFAPLRHTMEEALRHICDMGYSPAIVIDVGAADGTYPLLRVFSHARFFWIEPLKEFENTLLALSKRFNGKLVLAAAGKSNGTATFQISKDLYGSSLLSNTSDKNIELRVINVIKLDDLVNAHKLYDNILLKIDVQGYELDVLEGAQHLLQKCDIVILEMSFFKFGEHFPSFADVIDYMRKRCFVVYDIFDGHNRPFDGALAQRDFLFVKDNGRFRQSHQWATSEQLKMYDVQHNKTTD